jgi:hypothetical protein
MLIIYCSKHIITWVEQQNMEYMCLCIGWSGFDSWQGKIFLSATTTILALGPTLPPIQWYQGSFLRGEVAGAWTWPLTSI